MKLSEPQQRLLHWIEGYIVQHGCSPSRREMRAAMGYKTLSSIQNHLFNLREHGYLDWQDKKFRSVQVLRSRTARIPLVGAIAAHSLVETFPDAEIEYVDLSSLFLAQGRSLHEVSQYFALRVWGDSMIGALINDGDIVVMKPPASQAAIKNGTIIAARVEGQTTLKYFYCSDTTAILKPANPNYAPTQIPVASLDIQGCLMGVIRGLL